MGSADLMLLEGAVHCFLRHAMLVTYGSNQLVKRVLKVLLEKLICLFVTQVTLLLDLTHLHPDLSER